MSSTILTSNILPPITNTPQVSNNPTQDGQQLQNTNQSSAYGSPYILDISQFALSFTNGTGQSTSSSSSGAASGISSNPLDGISVTYASFSMNGSGSSASTGTGSTSPFEQLLAGLTGNTASSAQNTGNVTGPADTDGDSPASSLGSGASGTSGNLAQLLQFIEQLLAEAQSSLQNGINTATAGTTTPPTTSATTASVDPNASASTAASAMGTGSTNPVEQFLTRLENNPNLTDAQKQAVQNIATQYQDASATPGTFQQVHQALQQAGINVGHHGGHHHHGGGGGNLQALLQILDTSSTDSSTDSSSTSTATAAPTASITPNTSTTSTATTGTTTNNITPTASS